MPAMPVNPAHSDPLPEGQRRLQNAVQQLIALKNAQAQLGVPQVQQHAMGLLDALCQPRQAPLSRPDPRFGNTAELPPQLGLMRHHLQKVVQNQSQLHG